ncbi:hypothetical protein SDC9_125511 [bioreactor metagenome]|uniref:Uncharacterized protein n=1 Tax=bioreactor metagenome TaxID=1076179 RepID=A0A645CN74_9ZZZZ
MLRNFALRVASAAVERVGVLANQRAREQVAEQRAKRFAFPARLRDPDDPPGGEPAHGLRRAAHFAEHVVQVCYAHAAGIHVREHAARVVAIDTVVFLAGLAHLTAVLLNFVELALVLRHP